MVLFEMLAGQGPFDQKGSYSAAARPDRADGDGADAADGASLRRKRPDVPWAWRASLRKCLAPDPAQRYQRAAQLAADLRRFLEDLPLQVRPGAEPGRAGGQVAAAPPAPDVLGVGGGSRRGSVGGGGLQPRRHPTAPGRHPAAARSGPGRGAETGLRGRDPAGALPGQHHGGPARPPPRGAGGLRTDSGAVRDPRHATTGSGSRPGSASRRRNAARLGEDARELLLLLAWTTRARPRPGTGPP